MDCADFVQRMNQIAKYIKKTLVKYFWKGFFAKLEIKLEISVNIEDETNLNKLV